MTHVENETEQRLAAIEKQLAALVSKIGGKHNDELSISVSNAPTAQPSTSTDWS